MENRTNPNIESLTPQLHAFENLSQRLLELSSDAMGMPIKDGIKVVVNLVKEAPNAKGNNDHLSSNAMDNGWVSIQNGETHLALDINANLKDQTPYSLCLSLLHTSIHYISQLHGLKETSRQGRFHNKTFLQLALSNPYLETSHDEKTGTQTTLSDEGTKLVDSLFIDMAEFSLSRIADTVKPVKNKRSGFLVCSKCGRRVRTMTVSECEDIINGEASSLSCMKIECEGMTMDALIVSSEDNQPEA